MDIDMRALRDLAQDKEISLERLFEAIEQALLLAYERTEGARAGEEALHARNHVLDRRYVSAIFGAAPIGVAEIVLHIDHNDG